MIVSAIVAAGDNGVIGNKGKIPWEMPADSAFVTKTTMGHPLIMGSHTHDLIGKSLPGRLNVVISRRPDYKGAEGAIVVHTVDEALALEEVKNADEVFIFGGQRIYELAMPKTQRIYLTRVHTSVEGDAFFTYDPKEWQEISCDKHKADDKNPFDYDFCVLERK
jgi:dihydrofolate reductase